MFVKFQSKILPSFLLKIPFKKFEKDIFFPRETSSYDHDELIL